jgi:hypothetical protein
MTFHFCYKHVFFQTFYDTPVTENKNIAQGTSLNTFCDVLIKEHYKY